MLTIELLINAAVIAAFAIALCWIMTDPDMIFERPYLWLKNKLADRYEWLWFIIGGCPKCFAGQVSFWLYIYWQWNNYNLVQHLLFSGLTIYLTWLLMNHFIKSTNYGNKEN